MFFDRFTRFLSLASVIGATLLPDHGSGVTIYRVGAPFTEIEKDSLGGLGIDFREIDWSALHVQEALELDSLQAGSLQPNFIDEEEDIATTILDRDGWIGVRNFATIDRLAARVLVDGDESTAYTWPGIAPESFGVKATGAHAGIIFIDEQVTIDLGGRFLIREVVVRPLEDRPEHFIPRISVGVRDRGFHAGNSIPNFQAIVEVLENTEPEIRMVIDPPVLTEAVQIRAFRTTPKEIGLASFEVFGGGFVSPAKFESEVIELKDVASLGEIRWSGRRDPGARIHIRTRAGSDPQPVVFWETRPEQQDSVRYLDGGGDLTLTEYRSRYSKLADLLKPSDEKDRESADTENWSYWSSPYSFETPGVDIVSPGPRKYVQVRADFISTIEDGGKLDYIQFKASSPPLVRELLGEIYPTETSVGEPTRFTYYISPGISAKDNSFDGVEISTPSGLVSVDSLRIDAINYEDFSSRIREDGLGFEVLLPRRLESADSGALVEVVFTAPVLREVGTIFEGKVFDTAKPQEVRQQILPGDASDRIESDRLAVKTSLSKSLVFSPRISPNPFTPNGDGVNDKMILSYKLLRVTSAVPVTIEIFDLSGRVIKEVFFGESPLGEYSHTWDGRDSADNLVAPGLYLYRIDAEVQSEYESTNGVVSVAY